MKKIERLGLVFELEDSDFVNDYMKEHECPSVGMINAIYLNGCKIYEWIMREYACWDYDEVGLTKEEMLSRLVRAIKVMHTISTKFKSMDQLDWEFAKMIHELATQLAVEYVCVNECVDDLYIETSF